jgi:nucleotide-binding universal stress UspA family protein
MKTILVPADFSKCSDNAIKYAIHLAEKNNSRLIFFHSTFTPILTQSQTTVYLSTVEAEKKNKTKILADHVSKIYKSLSKKWDEKKSGILVKFSANAVEDILEIVRKKDIDLVIMGTTGASGLKEVFMGSNTSKVIEKAECPVIAVPKGSSFKGIRQITFATDYHKSDIDVLKKLVEIAKPFNAHINVIHASDEDLTHYAEEIGIESFKNLVLKKVKYNNMSFHVKFGKYLEKILENYIKKESSDLIAMSTEERNPLEKILESSATKKMAYHTSIPLLAFHHKKESVVFI